jgi:F0F1-type ATP synthase membrane subunit a
VMLTTYFYLVPKLRMGDSISVLPVHAFKSRARKSLHFMRISEFRSSLSLSLSLSIYIYIYIYIYGVIKNDCGGFNNLLYTIHMR